MDSSTNPLLDTNGLPAFSAIRPEHIEPAIDSLIAEQRVAIDRIAAAGAVRDFDHVMLAQERLDQVLSRAWSPVSHLHSVADSEALRKAHGSAEEKLTDHGIEVGQNRDLYAAVQAVADRGDFAGLPVASRAAVEHALRDFRLSGVALEEPARSRFREIGVELSKLTTEFSNAVLDASEAWRKHITDERDLAGIPASGRAVLREYAREEKLDGYLVTLTTDMNTDAEFDPKLRRHAGIADRHFLLDNNRASRGVDRAAEFDQHAIAGGLDNAAAMAGDRRVHQRLPVCLQLRQRALLVTAHQPAIAGDVSRQHRRQSPIQMLAGQNTLLGEDY